MRRALRGHVRVRPEEPERPFEGRCGGILAHRDRREGVDPLRSAVLERSPPASLEQHIDHRALRRSEHHVINELLVLHMAAVAADQLHARARQRHLEHPGVRRVRQVEADDLAELRVQREVRLAADEQHVAEAPHRRVRRLRAAEGRDPPVLEEDVVEREHDSRWTGGQ